MNTARRACNAPASGVDRRLKLISDYRLFGFGLATLACGVLYYLVSRAPHELAILQSLTHVFDCEPAHGRAEIDRWLGWVPTFVHVVAFSLLSASISNTRLTPIVFWVTANLGFEIGQAAWSGRGVTAFPFLDGYFINGTFSPTDMAAAVAGGLIAYMIVRRGGAQESKL